jgi:hypothetical protein
VVDHAVLARDLHLDHDHRVGQGAERLAEYRSQFSLLADQADALELDQRLPQFLRWRLTVQEVCEHSDVAVSQPEAGSGAVVRGHWYGFLSP